MDPAAGGGTLAAAFLARPALKPAARPGHRNPDGLSSLGLGELGDAAAPPDAQAGAVILFAALILPRMLLIGAAQP